MCMAQSFTQAYDNRQDQPDNYISYIFDYYFEKDLNIYSIFQFDKLNFFPFNLLFLIILYNLLYLLFSFLNF
jgi:hypothetical protein